MNVVGLKGANIECDKIEGSECLKAIGLKVVIDDSYRIAQCKC